MTCRSGITWRASGMISICAVIAVRNEAAYLPVLLPLLAAQQIDVAILDHESTDGSRDLYAGYMGRPIISVQDLTYEGVYSQTQQLEAKQSLYSTLSHDWVVHHDADEVMEGDRPGCGLRDAICDADKNGFDAINFDEFVFLPSPGQDCAGKDYVENIRRYYFFEPAKNRLNRAWRRKLPVSNIFSGGHLLTERVAAFFPRNMPLRHYIALSEEHAIRKYVNRRFGDHELQRGWHANRVGLTKEKLAFPVRSEFLFTHEPDGFIPFRKDRPTRLHYWSW